MRFSATQYKTHAGQNKNIKTEKKFCKNQESARISLADF